MNRPWQLWGVFGVCLLVVLVAMGWITQIALTLEQSEEATRQNAELEESVRLALWRMESALSPLIAEESGRPYFVYQSFYSPERAYTAPLNEIETGEVLIPSPLLTATPRHVLVHFQIEPEGRFTSPQVPSGNAHQLVEAGYTTSDRIETSRARLAELQAVLDVEAMLAHVPDPTAPPERQARRDDDPERFSPEEANRYAQTPEGQTEWQQRRSSVEQQARMQQQVANVLNPAALGLPTASNVSSGAIKPIWQGDVLLLARRVMVGGRTYTQGCWLDWPGIKEWLTNEARDLLPALDLQPVESATPASDPRLLAALPVRLVPGALAVQEIQGLSAIRLSLIIAWACVLLAATAAVILMRGTVSLSERRAAFVSAVTHEMRTPLTTFRMYTDMLLKGMIPSEEKRRRYLSTLRTEAHRLGHLVENILAYAQLERSRDKRPRETSNIGALVARVEERLAARTEQAGLELVVQREEPGSDQQVRVDVSAVEQILFNLVDNACKYASAGSEPLIRLRVGQSSGRPAIEVQDYGPGISAQDSRRLFRAFCKSANEAAHSAPGVGLGLALSRRLARDMGGDLRLNESYTSGATFILTLPAA
jgi:signal transduction histidine kinase